MVNRHLRYLFVLLNCNLVIYSQNLEEGEKIAPDRPGFGDAVSVLPKFDMHIETGVGFEKEKFGSIAQDKYGINSTLLRYGVFKRTELRFDYNLWKIKQTNTSVDDVGFYPCRLGMKYHLVYNKGIVPAITFIGMQELQFAASQNFRSEYANTDLQLSFANKVSKSFALCYNIGTILDFSGSDPIHYYALALEFHMSDKIGYYVQGHGSLIYSSFIRYSRQNCETGIMFYPNHNIQLDLSGGLKVLETVYGSKISMQYHSVFFMSAGFSWRFFVKKKDPEQTTAISNRQ